MKRLASHAGSGRLPGELFPSSVENNKRRLAAALPTGGTIKMRNTNLEFAATLAIATSLLSTCTSPQCLEHPPRPETPAAEPPAMALDRAAEVEPAVRRITAVSANERGET